MRILKSSPEKLAKAAEYREKNKDKTRASVRAWQKRNPSKRNDGWHKIRQDAARRLLYSVRSRCRKLGIECSITAEDIVVPTYCPYLEIELSNLTGQGRHWSNPSLDRIDPTKGYTKGNIQVVSDLANRMKSNASTEQLLTFARNITKIHGGISGQNRSNNSE